MPDWAAEPLAAFIGALFGSFLTFGVFYLGHRLYLYRAARRQSRTRSQ